MVIFVSGGSGSGKSEFAEKLITESGVENRLYLASMRVWDAEGERRVERHRALRAGKGFRTVEFQAADTPAETTGCAVLLEDLMNLYMNEFYSEPRGALSRCETALRRLAGESALLVIVSNDVGADGADYPGETGELLAGYHRVERFAANLADRCYEVACGMAALREPEIAPLGAGLTLIIGGADQGAEEYALEHFGRAAAYTPQEAAGADVLLGLEEWLRTEREPLPKLERLLEQNPDIAIVCRELGCGVVPMEAESREWRERTGRVCCALALRAKRVVRLWCGIPTVLKGENS